jgi:SAM-dependent methyltransferase
MRLASAADFYNGPIYTHYQHHEGYAKRAQLFRGFPEPILIIGCGFGFLIEELGKIGKQALGIDASDWAVTNRTNDRVFLHDVLDPVECAILKGELGPFRTVVTEDMLPCLDDREAMIAAENCSKLAPIVIHMITEQGQTDLNYHSTGYWMSLTNQLTVSLEGM